MLLKAKIIGIGACGNKACIELMNAYPELANSIILINSTLKDIPVEYKDKAFELIGNFKGCGKERDKANELMMQNLRSGAFDYPFDEDDAMVIIVTSSEGGTGSGSSTLLAKYISKVYKTHIHFYVFTGFGEDARGLQNTVDLFKEFDESYTVQAISNSKFLEETNNNKIKAEKLANKKFVEDINILLGGTIHESEQNIDESDLLKIANTSGFMVIESVNLDKIKNVNDFNKRVTETFDNSKSLNIEPTCKRIGTILNISKKEEDFIDYQNTIIKERCGVPYEAFNHIQTIHDNNYMQIIASGLKMPIDDITEVYEEFIKNSDSVDKSKDMFFQTEFNTESGNDFNSLSKNSAKNIQSAKDDFFKEEKVESKPSKVIKTLNGEFIVNKDKDF